MHSLEWISVVFICNQIMSIFTIFRQSVAKIFVTSRKSLPSPHKQCCVPVKSSVRAESYRKSFFKESTLFVGGGEWAIWSKSALNMHFLLFRCKILRPQRYFVIDCRYGIDLKNHFWQERKKRGVNIINNLIMFFKFINRFNSFLYW